MLEAGFTTVRDVSAWPGLPDVALARAIDRGWVEGPRTFPSTHALGITGVQWVMRGGIVVKQP